MRIPDIQFILRSKAEEHRDPELTTLANELSRRKTKQRGRSTARSMCDELRTQIWKTHLTNPDLSQQDIAKVFGVNQGRVSETLIGHRQ